MSGPAANTRSILLRLDRLRERRVQRRAVWPSSIMSPSTAMRRPPRLRSTAPRLASAARIEAGLAL